MHSLNPSLTRFPRTTRRPRGGWLAEWAPRLAGAFLSLVTAAAALGQAPDAWAEARANGQRSEEMFHRARRMLHGWLPYADKETLLLPDRLPGVQRGQPTPVYTPHNSGADNYPFLILTSYLTDRPLYGGRMLEMLRNEIRYTNVGGGAIPGNFDFLSRELGPPSFFGAGEYAKDGLIAVTELLGRTPWYWRMLDMMEDFRRRAPVKTRFGNLPDTGAELNGDVLQTLARLIPMTGDAALLRWAGQIADAYVEEILPANHWLPGYRWDFDKKTDTGYTRLRDHGNEMIVGLTLLYAVERERGLPGAARYEPAVRRMLDRVLESANPDGMLFNVVENATLKPKDGKLSDNWGYVYGAIYTFYQLTGEVKYRDAVRKVLRNLPKYRNWDWENGGMDGYADSIESAIYLVNREPAPEALGWIESEMKVLTAYQREDGTVERWYGDGNFNRTLLLYALMKTQGCHLNPWEPGVELGAARRGGSLYLTLRSPRAWKGSLCFDSARHRRLFGYRANYVRLNEWPEWFTVDENTLYRLEDPDAKRVEIRLGSELIRGYELAAAAGGERRLLVSRYRP